VAIAEKAPPVTGQRFIRMTLMDQLLALMILIP
jgi:hypothetical protein